MKNFKVDKKTESNQTVSTDLYKEDEHFDFEDDNINSGEVSYKKLEEREEKDDYINPSMKKFRTVIGALCIVMFGVYSFNLPNEAFRDNLSSGLVENVAEGDLLSEESLKFEPKDATVGVTGGFGKLEISIWNFADVEDNDYVQVFIDGVEQGAPFSIRHKPVKISVPDKGVIQVQGVRDGSNNGITYAVFFNKTGETYLNTVPLNGMNSYTIISK